jgi:hypothetical protein
MRIGVVGMLLLALGVATPAVAGPHCGGLSGWSPVGATVPPRAQLVLWQQDTTILPTGSPYYIRRPKLSATIDGKKVAIRTRHVRTRDVVLWFIDVQSKRTGKLELHDGDGAQAAVKSYTIDPEWKPGDLQATTWRYSEGSTRMANRRYEGLAIAVDGAIAFKVRWRRDADDPWRSLMLPAVDRNGTSTAMLGETDCQTDDVPVAFLEHGIELDVTALLPDGSTKHVAGLDGRVVLPAAPAPGQ